MSGVRVIATGVRAALRQLEARVSAAARQALGQAAAYAAERARATTTFKDRTGKTRRDINRGARGPFSLFVRAGGASLFLEDGTSAHVIRPRRARALRFVMAGTTMFRASVHHPGTKATHFVRDARNDAEQKLSRFAVVGIGQAVSG